MVLDRRAVCFVVYAVFAFGACGAEKEGYPRRPIRVVTAEPGGGIDFASRLLAQGLTAALGQQVVVDNRGSASGIIAAQTVARAQPDGYTLLFYGSTVWIAQLLRAGVAYEPLRDFAPVMLAASSPYILIVHPALPAKSVRELIALAKGRPGEMNYASGGIGVSNHLGAELFKSMAGISIVHVPHKGTGGALNAMMGGQVQMMFSTAGSAAPHVRSGRVRALAITTEQPSALLPDLPTVAATLPGYSLTTDYGMFAPAGTPSNIIARINRECARILALQDVKDKLTNVGVEIVSSLPEQLAAGVKAELAKWGKVIRAAGIRED